MSDGALKIRLTAPPVEGKANQALREFLAEVLQVPVSRVEILAGQTSRNKVVVIQGVEPEAADAMIRSRLGRRGN